MQNIDFNLLESLANFIGKEVLVYCGQQIYEGTLVSFDQYLGVILKNSIQRTFFRNFYSEEDYGNDLCIISGRDIQIISLFEKLKVDEMLKNFEKLQTFDLVKKRKEIIQEEPKKQPDDKIFRELFGNFGLDFEN
ncbi:lsm1 [Anaeramoeba ignava]|uniref:Lsm1 n=1 Tax=Anaeramoeba ignava TaxID=1746090 RepID=A0A9Q0LMV5_ANAIG|nr:lsm1 [Anaeramoeba ignava]